jgi:hypothetical protein
MQWWSLLEWLIGSKAEHPDSLRQHPVVDRYPDLDKHAVLEMNVQLSLPSKILLTLCLVAVLISVNWVALSARRTTHLVLATGDLEGETYIVQEAFRTFMNAYKATAEIKTEKQQQ